VVGPVVHPLLSVAQCSTDASTLAKMSGAETRYADYAAKGVSIGRCVVLPGRQYTPEGPLLFFAGQAAFMRGWDVRRVWWAAAERGSAAIADEMGCVGDQLNAALDALWGRVLIVAKALGTLAAAHAASQGTTPHG
jgi:hypothetical protein